MQERTIQQVEQLVNSKNMDRDTNMIKQLHPTLKKCKCHYIGTKRELYKHFDDVRRRMKVFGEPAREFFAGHGEVPLNVDDPRLQNIHALRASLENISRSEAKALNFAEQIIPSGHRLDDNNQLIPRI